MNDFSCCNLERSKIPKVVVLTLCIQAHLSKTTTEFLHQGLNRLLYASNMQKRRQRYFSLGWNPDCPELPKYLLMVTYPVTQNRISP